MTSDQDNGEKKTTRNNACGPKTQAGKRRVRLNAVKDGLFAKELIVAENEKPEYNLLRTALREQYVPSTPMQQIGFERITCCAWRVKLSLRREMRRLGPDIAFQTQQDPLGNNQEKGLELEAPRWYALGRAELRAAARTLLDLRQDVKENGGVHLEQWKERLSSTFGDDFYDTLANWQPRDIQAILLAEQLVGHSRLYNMPLPESAELEKGEALIGDARSRWEMMVKIVDLQLQHVHVLHRQLDVLGTGKDLGIARSLEDGRYFATANNDLERAVMWYEYLKDQRL